MHAHTAEAAPPRDIRPANAPTRVDRNKHLQAVALACAMLGAGPAATQPTLPNGDTLLQLGSGLGNALRGVWGGGAPSQAPAPAQGAAPLLPAALQQQAQRAVSGPIPASYRALFQKGSVTGQDLYETLKAIRLELRARRSAMAWSRVSMALDQTLNLQNLTSGGMDVGKVLRDALLVGALNMMKDLTADVATKALDDYLQYLLEERRSALAEESITLPSMDGMAEADMKRTITMAALVVTARVSKKVLDKADADLESLKVDYKSLLTQREKAAGLLFATIDQRRAAQRASNSEQQGTAEGDLKRSLSDKDLAFIDASFNTMTLNDFAKDMAAQNLAIQYLQSKDPAAFKDYRTQADDVVRRTTGYVRTASGVAAFGALMLSFGHTVAEIAQTKNFDSVLLSLPLGIDFVSAAAPLASNAVAVMAKGVALPLEDMVARGTSVFFGVKSFSYTAGSGAAERGTGDAASAFKFIQQHNASDTFVGALFLNDSVGWLNRVRLCDPAETGRMLDLAVPQEGRTRFATDYFAWTEPDRARNFNFVNAFSDPGTTKRERELGNELLGRDLRQRTESLPLAEIQRTVEKAYGGWTDRQLMNLIFHNRESGAAYATLEIGDLAIRPVPSPVSVYAYESRVESCRKSSDRDIAAEAADAVVRVAAPAPRPAAAPAAGAPRKNPAAARVPGQ